MWASTHTTADGNFRPIIVTHRGVYIIDIEFSNEEDAFARAMETFKRIEEHIEVAIAMDHFDTLIENN